MQKKVLILFPLSVLLIGLMLFVPAGSLEYWAAWVFMETLFIPFIFVLFYLLKHDPALLERRMRFKEKEAKENILIKITQLLFLIGFLIPGLDYRYGWSDVPLWIIILSNIIIFSGYMLVFNVFRQNTYTSRIIEVEKDQKVITTGLYSIIRHPMYAGLIPMYIFMPLALGSYYALIPILPSIIIIILRIYDEEKVLGNSLNGYKEYCKKVRYRLIPGIW